MSTPNNLIEKTEVEGRKLSIVEALREALQEEMRRDERVILLGEDIGIKGGFGGAFTVTLGLSGSTSRFKPCVTMRTSIFSCSSPFSVSILSPSMSVPWTR